MTSGVVQCGVESDRWPLAFLFLESCVLYFFKVWDVFAMSPFETPPSLSVLNSLSNPCHSGICILSPSSGSCLHSSYFFKFSSHCLLCCSQSFRVLSPPLALLCCRCFLPHFYLHSGHFAFEGSAQFILITLAVWRLQVRIKMASLYSAEFWWISFNMRFDTFIWAFEKF